MAVDPTDTDKYKLGSSNLFVLQDNASVIDEVVNGDDNAYTNRFGDQVMSLKYMGDSVNEIITEGQQAIIQFNEDSEEVLTQIEEDASEAISRISAWSNTGDWVAENDYNENDLWQDPSTLTWYWVVEAYTSSTVITDDIESSNVVIFSGSTYNYNYSFINTVLGDKITLGDEFNDVDTFDSLLGKVYEGTASASEIALTDKVNAQLGLVYEG
jgi:hypothetical protein